MDAGRGATRHVRDQHLGAVACRAPGAADEAELRELVRPAHLAAARSCSAARDRRGDDRGVSGRAAPRRRGSAGDPQGDDVARGDPAASRRGAAHPVQPAAGGAQGAGCRWRRRSGRWRRFGSRRCAATADLRDASIVSVLAYAGLRPGELRGLRWGHVRERTLLVNAGKTSGAERCGCSSSLAADLRAVARGVRRPGDRALVFPDDRGGLWTANGFEKWRAAALSSRSRERPSWTSGAPVRPAALVRVAAAARGPRRDLRRASARARRGADDAHLRARDRGARGLAAAAGRGGDPAGARAHRCRRDVPVLYPRRGATARGHKRRIRAVEPRPDLDSNQGPTP